jgi:hypothetical protein
MSSGSYPGDHYYFLTSAQFIRGVTHIGTRIWSIRVEKALARLGENTGYFGSVLPTLRVSAAYHPPDPLGVAP